MIFQVSDFPYKSFFENAFDGLAYCQVVFDAQKHPIDFIYKVVNKNFEKLTGLKGIAGKRVAELAPETAQFNKELFEMYGRVSSLKKPERVKTYLGKLSRWFLISMYVPQNGFFMVALEDVTDQKQRDKDLSDARMAAQNVFEDLSAEETKYEATASNLEKFKLALDNISDNVIITNPEGIVVYANEAVQKVTGYTPEEVIGKKSGALWKTPMPLPYYQKLWDTIKNQKKTFVGEIQNRRKNGEIYTATINISPILGANGTIDFFMSVERDITEELTAKKKLTDAKATDEAILFGIGDGLVVTDRDGKIIMTNHAFEEMLGWKTSEAIGKQATDILKRFDDAGNIIPFKERVLTQVLAGEKIATPITNHSYFKRKNGTQFPVRIVVTPVFIDNAIVGAVEVFQDITKEREVDRAKSEFISLASHQLRTPPSIIGWYTETLQSGDLGPINEKQAGYLAEIYRANQRMVAIINSLLNISRIEMNTFAISPKAIDIKEIINETVRELESRFHRKIELTMNYNPQIGLFEADPNIMQIIIDNLLSNSFKYSPPENTKIEITVSMEKGSLLLSVKDNGIGIPGKDQGRVFEKLFRADNAIVTNPDGTGLGLYMIKKIVVDGLNGTTWFDSKENNGSTFYVSIPSSGMKEKKGATTLARIL
jgi:PAS domain S-box-containing protein